jgi:type VI secretion system protein ImpI/type VI secretion system protein
MPAEVMTVPGAMTLTLSILRCPDGVPPETRQVRNGEFTIGRGTECDWVLPDPERVLSKRHCVVTFDGNGWQVTDTSTNGTFLNQLSDRLDAEAPRPLRDGDRLVFGAYEIEAAIARPATAPAPAGLEGAGNARSFTEDRLTSDPFPPLDDKALDVGLPTDDVALGAADGWSIGKFLGGGTGAVPDHVPAIQENFRPPRTSFEVLPDDWDEDLDGAAPGPASGPPPADAPSVQAPAAPAADAAAAPFPPQPVLSPMPAPVFAPAPAPPPAAPAVAAAPEGGSPAAALAAFIEGAGVRGQAHGDPVETLRGLGGAFRAMVTGLRRMMIARAAIKGEFRIEQTMIRPAGNNPLKFSADDEDALAGLIGVGRRSDMSARDAVADALHDMRMHELAVSSAMQQAVHHLLAELAPEQVMRGVGRGALDALPGRRKARGWEAYEALHAGIAKALADDFDSVFGKSFARAYERAMAELAEQSGD